MKQVKYILVHETSSKNPDCDVTYRDVPNIGHCVVIDAGFKWQVSGSKSRAALLDRLVRLRRHWPDAKILGVSEINPAAAHAPIRVSEAMNQLRRELSDLP